MAKLGNQRHLAAIRDAFAIFTPILIAGSLAIVLRSAVFAQSGGEGTISGLFVAFDDYTPAGGYKSFLEVMNNLFVYLQWGTINLMAIYFVFGLGYYLSLSRNNSTPVIGGLVSLTAFLAGTDTVRGGISFLGANGLIGGIISGIIFTELFLWLTRSEKLKITMPSGVPPAVGRAFSRLFPIIITLFAASLLSTLISMPFYFTEKTIEANGVTYTGAWMVGPWSGAQTITLTSAIFVGVVQPFITFSEMDGAGLGIALLYVLLISFFWFFGLHGTNIVNAGFNALWLLLLNNNIAALDAGKELPNIFAQGTFDAYIFIGGWGATLALLIATLIFGKKGSPEKEISKYALPAGVFQINEPVTFGYPLVLNGILFIPLFLVMPLLVMTTWLFIGPIGLVPKTRALIPWTTPVGFGGLIGSGSVWGFVLAVMNLAIATVVWTPFVLLNKNGAEKAAKAAETVEGKRVAAKNAAKAEAEKAEAKPEAKAPAKKATTTAKKPAAKKPAAKKAPAKKVVAK